MRDMVEIFDIGINEGSEYGKWRGDWVSKSDITHFMRCPFLVYATNRKGLRYDEVIDSEFIKYLCEKGIRFEEEILSSLKFKEVEDIEATLKKDVLLQLPQIVRNHELGIQGKVDLIRTKSERLYPTEIKNHKEIQDTDKIELAFYWRLLEPLRKKKNTEPKGYVRLNTGEVVEIILHEQDLIEIESLIRRVRNAKNKPPGYPQLSNQCKICSFHDELCLPLVRKHGGLTQLWGIGPVREEMLRKMGIRNIQDLASASPKKLPTTFPKIAQLRANALLEGKVYQIGPFNLPEKLIFFDIETDIQRERIWLIGAYKDNEFVRFYADTWKEEEKILRQFTGYLQEHQGYTLVSYSGTNFDRNVLLGALSRLKVKKEQEGLSSFPHKDIYSILRNSFIFPLKSFALKELGVYLGYPFKHPDMDGVMVALKYQRHVENKKPLDAAIFEYNMDDVKILPFIIKKLTDMDLKIEKKIIRQQILPDMEHSQELFGLTEKKAVQMLRESYEQYGYLSIRKDKRYNCWKADFCFITKDIKILEKINQAMSMLGFNAGSPYNYHGKWRLPFYGRQQVVDFITLVEPRVKNDISKLTGQF